MTTNSSELNNHFGKVNKYDFDLHLSNLRKQFGIEKLPENTLDTKLQNALKETRNEVEKFYLQVLLENGLAKYNLGVEKLESEMKFSVAGILSGEIGNA